MQALDAYIIVCGCQPPVPPSCSIIFSILRQALSVLLDLCIFKFYQYLCPELSKKYCKIRILGGYAVPSLVKELAPQTTCITHASV